MNGGSKGRSAEEIKELLHKCTANVMKLEKYNEQLEAGKVQGKENRKEMHTVMANTFKHLQRSRDLLKVYDGNDTNVYSRKLNNLAERIEETITEIKDKEDKDLENIRKSFARMSMVSNI